MIFFIKVHIQCSCKHTFTRIGVDTIRDSRITTYFVTFSLIINGEGFIATTHRLMNSAYFMIPMHTFYLDSNTSCVFISRR